MEYNFLCSPHGSFFQIDHIFTEKASLNRHKKIEIAPNIFSDYQKLTARYQPKHRQ